MAELSHEWFYWSLVNGLPAAFATIMFIVYKPFGEKFAWNVEHRQSSIYLGIGFLLRAGLFVHIITARYWGEIKWMVWGNVIFAGVLLGITMIYGERFHWRRLIAIGWLFLYVEEPAWMLSLVPEARSAAAAAGPLAGAAIHPVLQAGLLIEAVVMLAAGIYLFFLNKFPDPNWPWKPDLVSARILSGWPLAWVAWAPSLAFAGSWLGARAGVLLNLVWLGALLASLFIFRSQFDLSKRNTRIHAGVIAALFIILLGGYLIQILTLS
jgi:hypothetical protein